MSNNDHFNNMLNQVRTKVLSKGNISQFSEVNNFLVESIINGLTTVPIDMPEVLYRLKLGHDYELDVLEDVLNDVCNKIMLKKSVNNPKLAAQQLFPEMFLKPRDDYIYKILREAVS